MHKRKVFSSSELLIVNDAVAIAEELVSNYFKMSSGQWLRIRYDVKTAKQLNSSEKIDGPFAQVVGYDGRKKNAELGSSTFNYYAICLQDNAILDALKKNNQLLLLPFLVYIVVHELVHIVRFGKFQQIYEASSATKSALHEEVTVHDITRKIVSGISLTGMDKVLKYYKKWVKKN